VTRAEQRLNSNHGRLIHVARAVPVHLRGVPIPGWGWTPRDVLAHVLAWQEEALTHIRQPDGPGPACRGRDRLDAWNATANRVLRDVPWDEVMARLEANHRELRACLGVDPPRWFGPCTYWHYTEHTRSLLAHLRSAAQSSTTTVVPIAAQS
jgi:hypothetical protein